MLRKFWIAAVCASVLSPCAATGAHKSTEGTAVVYPSGVGCPPILSDYGSWTNSLGQWRRQIHRGIDIPEKEGYPVIAVDDGQVFATGKYNNGGNYVQVRHSHPFEVLISEYIHLSKISVEEGTIIKRGDKVGEVGLSGNTSGDHTHLHLNIKAGYGQKNPHDYWIDYDGGGAPIVIAPFISGKYYKAVEKRRFTYPVPCK